MKMTMILFALIPVFLIGVIYYFVGSRQARNKRILTKKTKEYEIRKENFEKPKNSGFWLNMIDDKLYSQLREMGNGNLSIIRWQKSRVKKVTVMTGVGFVITIVSFKTSGFTSATYITLLISIALPLYLYFNQKKSISGIYNQFRFERQMQFSKFCRLLVPYLKQKSSGSMYSIFNKIVPRLDYEADRNQLMMLMKSMTDSPTSLEPYKEFAQKMSGTDMADSFMTTVFDMTQGVTDTSVVEDLGRMASESMMEGIDQIIEYKSRKFVYTPMKIAMAFVIPIIGYAIGVLLYNISTISITFG